MMGGGGGGGGGGDDLVELGDTRIALHIVIPSHLS